VSATGAAGLVGGILLAAGRARRFGADKREVRLGSGESLLERGVARMREAVDELVLVVGEGDSVRAYATRFPGVRVVRSPRSAAGMGYSLADAVAQSLHWDACLVSLVDKPFIRGQTHQRVRALLAEHVLVVPTFEGTWGHPVGFARQHFYALSRLEGDAGARELIRAERERCLFVELADPGVVADVDTPEQLGYWRSLFGD